MPTCSGDQTTGKCVWWWALCPGCSSLCYSDTDLPTPLLQSWFSAYMLVVSTTRRASGWYALGPPGGLISPWQLSSDYLSIGGSPSPVFLVKVKPRKQAFISWLLRIFPQSPSLVQNPNTCYDGYQSFDPKSLPLARVLELVKRHIILNRPWRWFCFSQSPDVIVLLSCILSPLAFRQITSRLSFLQEDLRRERRGMPPLRTWAPGLIWQTLQLLAILDAGNPNICINTWSQVQGPL